MKSSIQKRLRASINIDAINGNREERAICQSQMYEAANTIEALQSENATLKADLADWEAAYAACGFSEEDHFVEARAAAEQLAKRQGK